jgi:hypothetical protein
MEASQFHVSLASTKKENKIISHMNKEEWKTSWQKWVEGEYITQKNGRSS